MIMLSYHTWTLWFYVDWMNEVLIKEKKRKDDNQAMSVSVTSNRPPVHQRESTHMGGLSTSLCWTVFLLFVTWRDTRLLVFTFSAWHSELSRIVHIWSELCVNVYQSALLVMCFWFSVMTQCVSDFWWWHKLICSNLVFLAGWCSPHVVRRSSFVYR